MSEKRIRWSDEQLLLVAQDAAKSAIHPTNFTTKHLKYHQKVLPPGLHRRFFASKFVKDFRSLVAALKSKEIQEVKPAPVSEDSQLIKVLEKLLTPFIVAQIEQGISALKESLLASLKVPESRTVVLPAVSVGSPSRKRKVLIVGLKEDQQSRVSQEFDDVFSLSFYKDKGSHRDLRVRAENSDFVFLMVRFVSHSQQICVKRCPLTRLVSINGCESELHEKLLSLYVDGKVWHA